jgi:hypothetical protein
MEVSRPGIKAIGAITHGDKRYIGPGMKANGVTRPGDKSDWSYQARTQKLSPLEVEELEAHNTDEPEEGRETAQDADNDAQIVLLVSKVPAGAWSLHKTPVTIGNHDTTSRRHTDSGAYVFLPVLSFVEQFTRCLADVESFNEQMDMIGGRWREKVKFGEQTIGLLTDGKPAPFIIYLLRVCRLAQFFAFSGSLLCVSLSRVGC